ncbi:MAG: acetylornithine deacetylase [Myxococcota bacterium]|jgi:acetylornithine deacetylase
MTKKMSRVRSLLRDLVATPSVSGDEHAVVEVLADWLRGHGLSVRVDDRNLECRVGEGGPVVLLNSHTDVVPPGEGWHTDPFVPTISDVRMVGRGCNDAKASVAAMACAMVELAALELPGSVVFAATCEEERGREGLERFLPSLGRLDAAIVGEPTGLHPAVSQNGLLLLELYPEGRAGHAARPTLAVNALDIACRDVVALHDLEWEPADPHVGPMTLVCTQLEAGRAHNVIPESARVVVDIRTIPQIPPDVVIARVREVVRSRVHVRSNRLPPVRTPAGAAILDAVRAALPDAVPFGSPTLSDWAHLVGVPAVKLGPGLSEVSHTANEWVELAMVDCAVGAYVDIVRGALARL